MEVVGNAGSSSITAYAGRDGKKAFKTKVTKSLKKVVSYKKKPGKGIFKRASSKGVRPNNGVDYTAY